MLSSQWKRMTLTHSNGTTCQMAQNHVKLRSHIVNVLWRCFLRVFYVLKTTHCLHKPPTNCETRPPTLLHHHAQHWLSTRLCAEPTSLLLVQIWLHSYPPHQHHHQICLWHHGDRTHRRRRWISLQRWDTETGSNNLSLNTSKTKELILDHRRGSANLAPLHINGDCVEKVDPPLSSWEPTYQMTSHGLPTSQQ